MVEKTFLITAKRAPCRNTLSYNMRVHRNKHAEGLCAAAGAAAAADATDGVVMKTFQQMR